MAYCPEAKEKGAEGSGMTGCCFNCGMKDHTTKSCPSPLIGGLLMFFGFLPWERI